MKNINNQFWMDYERNFIQEKTQFDNYIRNEKIYIFSGTSVID